MILLLGGCGFLGRSLADHLYSRGHSVKILDRPEPVARRRRQAPGPVYHVGDFARLEHEEALFDDVSAVVHLVHSTIPATSMEDLVFDAESNILPSIRALDVVRQYGIRRFLFVSSGGTVYGMPRRLPVQEDDPTLPLCAYGISKLAIEKYVQLFNYMYGLEGIVVRLSNPYGHHQLVGTPVGAVANFLLRTARGMPIEIWGDGSAVRDYIYIDDVVDAIEALLTRPGVSAGVYNLGSGVGYSLHDVLNIIQEETGLKADVEYRPSRRLDVPEIVLNVSRIERELNWRSRVSLRDGVRLLWAEIKRARDN